MGLCILSFRSAPSTSAKIEPLKGEYVPFATGLTMKNGGRTGRPAYRRGQIESRIADFGLTFYPSTPTLG